MTILGQQYTLRSDATSEQVQEVVDFVSKSLADVAGRQKTVDTLDAAVLTLLNVTGSYLQLKKNSLARERQLDRLLEKIEQMLADRPESGKIFSGEVE